MGSGVIFLALLRHQAGRIGAPQGVGVGNLGPDFLGFLPAPEIPNPLAAAWQDVHQPKNLVGASSNDFLRVVKGCGKRSDPKLFRAICTLPVAYFLFRPE
ncbi:MAG TPA: hypothetical protein DCE44_16570 [Verrucomicrobiales bacterium]|nr:hypothetical protein [Verrucomicrobiales bacterium]